MKETRAELKFPKRFLWGVATSAHQFEGGNHNNWSVWELENAKALAGAAKYKIGHLENWKRIRSQAVKPDNYVSGRAADHYNRYESDFDIVRKMHLNAFRFSIEWSRVEPEEGAWDAGEIEHYRQYIRALRRRGIEPVVTLYHWTVPVWFSEKGAFARSGNVKYFVRFADKVLEELGKELRLVITVNEPDTVAGHGYYLQEHPPATHSAIKALWVYRNHLKAHRLVYGLAKRRSRRFKVGFAKAYSNITEGDERFVTRLAVWWHRFTRDTLPLGYVGRRTDFLGVNYYFSDTYQGAQVRHDDIHYSDLGWGMHPENLKYVLLRLGRQKKPILITETGVADEQDALRKNWLNGTIRAVHEAMKSGVNIQGYLFWSLLDNFEWAYGRWPRFGLVGIDYDDGLRRVPRKSALYYAAVVKKVRGL